MMWPEAAKKKFGVLKCCLCIYAALRAHTFINYDINSCHLGYFLATYQTYLSAANMSWAGGGGVSAVWYTMMTKCILSY